ncbi:transaldolase [Maribacter sp. CXY002]|uniref:transaldolase n=1 Tax=Maribacter luteocoastalis TaxID=3407671 RepID=UPI003B679176
MDKYLPLALILLIFSCNTSNEESDEVIFAGEIVNPTDEYVVLYKGSSVIDSAKLDGNNRFSFHLNSVENGLYHFNHKPEQQYVFLEKGDSLMVRLNTMYFDESLVFSGTNEELNNFLIEVFLADEEVEQTMYSEYYELEAADFSMKIDALRKEKLNVLDKLKTDADLSETAYEIAEASINYTFYKYKEIYPFKHKRKLKEDELHNLPKDFYAYRKAINYNNKNLIYLRPYYHFMKSHLGNLSYMTCSKSCGKENGVITNQLHFNQHKLTMIDSLLAEKELRDNLFRNVAFDYLLREHDEPDSSKIFIDEFQKVSGNNMHIKEIEKLYQGIRNIQPNSPVPAVKVLTMDSLEVSLTDITKNKNVVFYFWSATDKSHYENIFNRVRELEKMKPDYDFIGINIRTENNNWKAIVKNSKLTPGSQFRAGDFEQLSEKLILYPMNKCIIAKDALIVDAFSNIYRNL